MNSRRVECGSQTYGFGILGYAVVNDAMKGLAPPLICGNIQAWHRGRTVLHLRGFFGKSHALH